MALPLSLRNLHGRRRRRKWCGDMGWIHLAQNRDVNFSEHDGETSVSMQRM
jgi:hypothetical protein